LSLEKVSTQGHTDAVGMNNYSGIKIFLRGVQAAAFITLTATGAVAMSTAH
jgi:hypothetical protein